MSSQCHHHPLLPSFLLLLFFWVHCAIANDKLLVLYMDAMHWKYVERRLSDPYEYPVSSKSSSIPVEALVREPANGLRLMRRLGSYVHRVRPVFPTQCLPNIHSAFTGLLPRYHGILGSEMYDRKSGFHFNYYGAAQKGIERAKDPAKAVVDHFDAAPGDWWKSRAEPLWDTVAKQTGRRSHIYHLPSVYELREVERRRLRRRGVEAMEEGRDLNHVVLPYRRDLTWLTFHDRVLESIGHLRRNVTDFAVVYSDALDRAGHSYGPNSVHVENTMKALDSLLHMVIHEVLLEPQLNIHVMLMSDHGMQTISQEKEVNLEWFILRSQLDKLVNDGTIVGIWPRKDYVNEVYKRLVQGLEAYPAKYSVYWKNDPLIERYFGRGPTDSRVPTIVVVAKSGYVLITKEFPFPRDEPTGAFPKVGLHGYHPSQQDMHTAMMVFGSKIVAGKELDSLHVTDVYHLMSNILGVSPKSPNGSFKEVTPLLRAYRMKMNVEDPKYAKLRSASCQQSFSVVLGLLMLLLTFSFLHLS